MRAWSTQQRVLFETQQWTIRSRVWVQNAAGTWTVNLCAPKSPYGLPSAQQYSDIDFVDSWEAITDIDQPVATARVEVMKNVFDLVLVPGYASRLNRFNGADSDLLMVGKRLYIEVQMVPDDYVADTAGTNYPWNNVFDGFIDEIEWGHSAETITLVCRDKAGQLLQDVYIETERNYGSLSGVPAETVGQALIDDNWPSSPWPKPVLYTPASPGFQIQPGYVPKEGIYGAIQKLAEMYGWDLRYFFDSTGGSTSSGWATTNTSATVTKANTANVMIGDTVTGTGIPASTTIVSYVPNVSITLSQPATATGTVSLTFTRAKSWYLTMRNPGHGTIGSTSLDFTTTGSSQSAGALATLRYDFVRALGPFQINIANVRNAVALMYTDAATKRRQILTPVTDATSITNYGRRYMEIPEGAIPFITNATDANVLANAALSDLKNPTIVGAATTRLFWPVALGDAYVFPGLTPNWLHIYGSSGSGSYNMSVLGYTHRVANGGEATTEWRLQQNVKPGGLKKWARKESRPGIAPWNSYTKDPNAQRTRVYGAGSLSPATLATATAATIIFDAVTYDLHADYNSGTGAWSCPVAGTYTIEAQVSIVSLNAGVNANVYLWRNGAAWQEEDYVTSGAGDAVLRIVCATQQFAAGDTVQVRAAHYDSATRSIKVASDTDTWLSIRRLT